MQPWHLAVLADVFLQQAHLVRRYIQPVLPTILDVEIIPLYPIDFLGFYTTIFTDTMLDMDHIIPHIDFPEMGYPVFLAGSDKFLFLAAKNILFGYYYQFIIGQLEPI